MKILEKVGFTKGSYVMIRLEDNRLIIEPYTSTAEKYRGIIKTETLPDDLDLFLEEEIQKRQKKDIN